MSGDETYWLYSASKLVTCVAALTLYERGMFLMTDPVSAYLQGFDRLNVRHIRPDGTETIAPARHPMTIRSLFNMTSGLDYNLHTQDIETAIVNTKGRAPTVEMASVIARRPLLFEPGSHFAYGLSHDVLAAMVEVISGQRFGEYVRRILFEPCGMTRSGYHLTPELGACMAKQYRYREETRTAEPGTMSNEYVFGSEYESGGAGMISCVEDYMRFLNMLCAGGVTSGGDRVLSSRTIDLMRINQLSPVQMRDFDWPHFSGYGYGLGVRTMVDPAEGGSLSPVGEYGWSGAAGAFALVDPCNHLTVYYAQHMLNNQEPYLHPRLRNVLYAALTD